MCVCVCGCILVSCYIFRFTLQRIDEYDEFVRIINVYFRHVQQLFWVCYILLNSKCNIVEQEMLILPEHLSSPMVFSEFRVAQSSIFRVCFARPFFSFSFDHCINYRSFFRNTASDYHFDILKLFFAAKLRFPLT